jgi:hypothetical protein
MGIYCRRIAGLFEAQRREVDSFKKMEDSPRFAAVLKNAQKTEKQRLQSY